MLKKVFRFLFSVCLIVLGIGMSLYPAVRSEKIHMEAISYQKEVDNATKYKNKCHYFYGIFPFDIWCRWFIGYRFIFCCIPK